MRATSPSAFPARFAVLLAVGLAVATALTLPRRGGTALLLGISGAGRATIDPDVVTLNQLRVQGGFAASTAAWRWVAGLYATGALDPTPLVTHQFPLDQVATAFAALTAPDSSAVKILIRMEPSVTGIRPAPAGGSRRRG